MKAVYLLMHQSKPNLRELTRKVTRAFQTAGISVSCEPWLFALMGEEAPSLFDSVPYDAVVSVGGDGTFLRANQLAAQSDIPLLGVNMGRVGFLAEIELEQLPGACQRLQTGDFTVESRMMLEASFDDEEEKLLALNDIVVSRGGYARLIAVKAWVDQELVGRYIADGLIVSTPTGSTGYSLSAGGPIVYPGVDCMILSPICAHSLQHRPVVLSARQAVTLELDCEPYQQAQLSADGQKVRFLTARKRITVSCAPKRASLIRFNSQSFFDVIRQKLTEWSC